MTAHEGSAMQEQGEAQRKERERKADEERQREQLRVYDRLRGVRQIIHVTKQSDMPRGHHWAIVKYKTITEPAYEGGTSALEIIEYDAYPYKEDWEAAIHEIEERYTKEPYTAMEVKPAAIKRTVTVGIE